jgi:hypothetical protein
MSDILVKQVEQPEVPQKEGKREADTRSAVEPPYLDYVKVHNHPFIVDHFRLGDTWQEKVGGFEKEVTEIEDYFKGQIEQGQLRNDTKAVKDRLKAIYKVVQIDTTERVTMQIEKLAAYLEFLRKTDNISQNHYKYGR